MLTAPTDPGTSPGLHWPGILSSLLSPLAMPTTLIDPMPRIVLGLTAWMAVWWVTEPVPILVTSFLPMIVLPLTGVMPMNDAVVGYANPVIYMYMGGFILAIAIERWNLHRRIALSIVNRIGNSLRSIVLGVLVASAFLSMWISNAAVFSSGRITIKQMAKAGIAMNLVSALVITLFVYFIMPLLLPTP
ncbi:SLC13 family permease [Halomonas sp. 141]|uniref:SLC13 family permease n=1 Tax=Halomonas sp. 141 TaxID=2056666 RepID=UPI001E40BEC6|nr:SLC13 family permease [Halomonas sp. 141]